MRPTTRKNKSQPSPSPGAWMLAVVAIAGAWFGRDHIAWPFKPAPKPDPAPIVVPVDDQAASDASHAAAVAYFHELATAYDSLAKKPPETTREAAEAAQRADAKAADALAVAINAILAPRIGAEELDPDQAKRTFSSMADGFRMVK